MNKLIVRVIGGLGNQLFLYSTARRMALLNDKELVLDDVSGFIRDPYKRNYQLDHFNIMARKAAPYERLEPFSRVRRKIYKYWSESKEFNNRKYITQDIKHVGIEFDSRMLFEWPNGIHYMEGFWQSEFYFKDVENVIRSDLHIQAPVDGINQSLADIIRTKKNPVSLHIRFFDNVFSEGSVNNIALEYYTHAISVIEDKCPDAHYFIFSDKVNDAISFIPLHHSKFTVVDHNQGDEHAYADLWLMTHCKHFIIANSTFSWWGAWLGEKSGSLIISPGELRGNRTAWGFFGLIPDRWQILAQ
jgi:hypothetical protein